MDSTDLVEVAARVRRFAHMVGLDEVDVQVERDVLKNRTDIVMLATKPLHWLMRLHYDDISVMLAEQLPPTVPVTVMGRPGGLAPNPAVNKRAFLDWLTKLIATRDGALAPSPSRGDWIAQHGTVPQCFKCGRPMREVSLKTGGTFWGCTGFRDHGCKASLNIDADGGLSPKCPDCGAAMALRTGTKGDFWSCGNYPGCKRSVDKSIGFELRTRVEDWLPDETGRRDAVTVKDRAAAAAEAWAVANGSSLPTTTATTPGTTPPATSGAKETLSDLRERFKRRM